MNEKKRMLAESKQQQIRNFLARAILISLLSPTQLLMQLKCLYTNAHSMRNKQEELETTVLLENYDLIAITET